MDIQLKHLTHLVKIMDYRLTFSIRRKCSDDNYNNYSLLFQYPADYKPYLELSLISLRFAITFETNDYGLKY
jgi:hypothetical protein